METHWKLPSDILKPIKEYSRKYPSFIQEDKVNIQNPQKLQQSQGRGDTKCFFFINF